MAILTLELIAHHLLAIRLAGAGSATLLPMLLRIALLCLSLPVNWESYLSINSTIFFSQLNRVYRCNFWPLGPYGLQLTFIVLGFF